MSTSPLLAGLHFAGGSWLVPILLLWLIAIAAVVWSYRRNPALPPKIRRRSLLLKVLGFSLLAFCLLEPEYVREVTEEEQEKGVNTLSLLFDNSFGMGLNDPEKRVTNELKDAAWRSELAETFQLREYQFDRQLRRSGPSELDYSGESSAIGSALKTVTRRTEGQAVSGIVVFTDGNGTDRDQPAMDRSKLPPIFPVVIGPKEAPTDLSLGDIQVNQTSFEESPITLRVPVKTHGAVGQTLHLELLEADGGVIEEQTASVAREDETVWFEFRHRPLEAGVQVYRVEVTAEKNNKSLEEVSLENNQRFVTVKRDKGPYRVLYISGRPNWEFKFLNRALQADREVELVGLIRVARREPKFAFRGRGGESANPLFQGFGGDREDAEYDEPVLIRMYTKDEEELRDGFPKEKEDLFGYRAIIVDDVEAAYFSSDQQELLEAYVTRRGGGLLMLGGLECFADGGYAETPMADMLPVYVQANTTPARQQLRLDLTREGWLQPWVRLRDTEDAERGRLETMSAFKGVNTVPAIKPGASLLATVIDGSVRRPALASQRYGNGRVGALLVADLWRWGFKQEEQREDMEKAWRQMVRWLMADVPDRVSMRSEPAGGSMRLVVQAQDEAFDPMPEATVTIEVLPPDGEPITLTAQASLEQPGRFDAACRIDQAGAWQATATVTDEDGEEVGSAIAGWSHNPMAEELKQLQPDRAWLQQLATDTGGELIELDEVASLPERIPHPTVSVTTTKVTSLWHLPLVFLLALGCFIGEWWMRRMRGAA